MTQKKNIILAAMAAAICLMALVWMDSQNPTGGTKEITVTVVHKDGSEAVFHCATAEQYLAPVLLKEGIVQGQQDSYGFMIHTVDGETADWNLEQSYWALYINGEYSVTGAESTVLTNGADYRLVYTIG